jgi:hypothetical protein
LWEQGDPPAHPEAYEHDARRTSPFAHHLDTIGSTAQAQPICPLIGNVQGGGRQYDFLEVPLRTNGVRTRKVAAQDIVQVHQHHPFGSRSQLILERSTAISGRFEDSNLQFAYTSKV